MTWTTRPCSGAVTTTASHHAGGGHRRGVGTRRRGPGRGGVPHPPSPSSRAAAAWGKAARVPNGRGPSVAACRGQTRRRAWHHVRVPTTPAGTRVDLGRQAIHPQASPSTAARCSRGVRGAAGWARNVHRASTGHACRGRWRKPAGLPCGPGCPPTGRPCWTVALSTSTRRPVARLRQPSANAVALRRDVVASGRRLAEAVPVRAATSAPPA